MKAIVLSALALAACLAPADSPKDIVAKIRTADYAGDRAALHRLARELQPYLNDGKIASRIRYWRGFAYWRSAINGFNEKPFPSDMESDLSNAVSEFEAARTLDPKFADATIGEASSIGYTLYMAGGDNERINALLPKVLGLMKQAKADAPDNPRFYWIDGPRLWTIGSSRGGGQDAAIACYERGLEMWRKEQTVRHGPLDPTWGEAELYMSLAWSLQNRTKPDLDAAHRYAQRALKLVPNWHYVRDILLPSIEKARNVSG